MRRLDVTSPFVVVLLAIISACSEPNNQQLTISEAASAASFPRTLANEDLSREGYRPFIGVALSGGGSRAANFSAAALIELDRLGFLEHVSAVSSVSGGSLPAAYYSLFYGDSSKWNETELRNRLITDFESKLIKKTVVPWHIVGSMIKTENRTEYMAEILDEVLFSKKTFRELGRPTFINATMDDEHGGSFIFTDQSFRNLDSKLDTFLVSKAVATSAAYPGAFNSFSLVNYKRGHPPYLRLYDGGIQDNLGIETLANLYRKLVADDTKHNRIPRDCYIFLVNSQLTGNPRLTVEKESTPIAADGYGLDMNALRASDQIYRRVQSSIITRYRLDNASYNALTWFNIIQSADTAKAGRCNVWHISLSRLTGMIGFSPEYVDAKDLVTLYDSWPVADQIPTRFALKGPPGYSGEQLQQTLFDAAHSLILRDPARPLLRVCEWFLAHGVRSGPCEEILSGTRILPAASLRTTARVRLHDSDRLDISGIIQGYVELPHDRWWYTFHHSETDESFVFPDGTYVVDPNTRSSMRFAILSIDTKLVPHFTNSEWFSFQLESDPDERSKKLLRELQSRFLSGGASSWYDAMIVYPALAEGRETAQISPVFVHPPRQFAPIKTEVIGKRRFQSLELGAVAPQSELLLTGVFITALEPVDLERSKWSFLLATYCVPANLHQTEILGMRAAFRNALATLDLRR